MKPRMLGCRAAAAALFAAFSFVAAAAAEIRVASSAGFKPAYLAVMTEFEQKSGDKLVNVWGPSMGETPQAVPNRLARGEHIDVVIVVGEALDGLIKSGKVVGASRADLARSLIGAAVRAGAPKPDISTVAAFKQALLDAKSIAYSDSASGTFLQNVIFKRLGIADDIKAKSKMIPADPVGDVVASGRFELGFQQMSELKPIKGIELLGPIPADVQKSTLFSAAITTDSKEPQAAAELIKFLTSTAAVPAIEHAGMVPAGTTAGH